MQATIYVTQEAMDTAIAIKDLPYYDLTSDDETNDLSQKEGFWLKNANKLKLAVLPVNAHVALCLTPDEPDVYQRHVSMPANLRGCIFEKAPHLPAGYAGIVTYWSGETVNTNDSGAVHYQCPLNEYMVNLTATTSEGDDADTVPGAIDSLLSEGVVVCLTGVEHLIADLSIHNFIEIKLPVDQSMLGIEPDDFRSRKEYDTSPCQQYERIFLSVADIMRSPDRDRVFIDVLTHVGISYGYFY